MPWRQLSFSLPAGISDAVSGFLERHGAQAITLAAGSGESLLEPSPGEIPLWRHIRLSVLFSMDTDTHAVAGLLQARFPALQGWEHRVIEDRPWERAWLQYFHPLNFGRLWVCPTGMDPADPDAVRLTLDPGLAFGTGTHPTTALCLEWLAAADLRGKTLVDYGCGSGILAVAALLLGAERAFACDIDPQALTATRENAAKNRVAERLRCGYPENMANVKADIVLANILAGPLVELAPDLGARVRRGGWLVLSGILEEQAGTVRRAYESRFRFDPPAVAEHWVRLSGKCR